MKVLRKKKFSHYLTTVAKPNKQGVITNKNLRYIIIQLNPALRFGVQYLIMC